MFSTLLTSVFVLLILTLLVRVWGRKDSYAVTMGPVILTTLGIFGCFLGIAIGLHSFSADNIQAAVPALIDGVKTSFWASVAGIGAALLLKIRPLFRTAKQSTGAPIRGATIDDLANLLRDLKTAIAGNEDSALVSQTKLLRQDSNDRLDTLNRSFERHLEQVAESNSKALIEALQAVIRDFNTKINEQFGENFKQLNHAVGQMLEWQANYREQMSEMIVQQRASAENMTKASSDYSQLVGQTGVFTEVAGQLHRLLSGLETQRDHLQASLHQLTQLIVAAGNQLPTIEKRILEMTQQIENGVKANSNQINATINAVMTSSQTAQADLKKVLVESINTTNADMNTHVKQMVEKTKEQVVALDHALSEELTKSIESLGKHLTALSEKFVEDYTPLTDRLRQLVRVGAAV